MITPTIANIEDAVRKYVASGTDVACVPGDRNGKRPDSGLYSTLLLLGDRQEGTAYYNDITDIWTDHLLSFSLQFYRDGASDAAALFKAYAESPLTDDPLLFRYASCSDPLRVDQLRSGDFEEQVALTLRVTAARRYTIDVDAIAAADIQILADGITDTIEVTTHGA